MTGYVSWSGWSRHGLGLQQLEVGYQSSEITTDSKSHIRNGLCTGYYWLDGGLLEGANNASGE
jgi:hypothetical protein